MVTLDALRLIGIYTLSESGREDTAILRLRDLILESIEDQRTAIIEGIDLNRLSPSILFWLLTFLPSVGLKGNILYQRVEGRTLMLASPRRQQIVPFYLAVVPAP